MRNQVACRVIPYSRPVWTALTDPETTVSCMVEVIAVLRDLAPHWRGGKPLRYRDNQISHGTETQHHHSDR